MHRHHIARPSGWIVVVDLEKDVVEITVARTTREEVELPWVADDDGIAFKTPVGG